ncbi:hypothetical protein POP12_117 [Pectobacterium phage POP12]|nr:hypothetical protein POP12_117 [Pectobacterium phage POP12]
MRKDKTCSVTINYITYNFIWPWDADSIKSFFFQGNGDVYASDVGVLEIELDAEQENFSIPYYGYAMKIGSVSDKTPFRIRASKTDLRME